MGPVLGSLIYGAVGFEATFFIFAGLMFLCGFLVLVFLPRRLNKMGIDTEEEKKKQEELAS